MAKPLSGSVYLILVDCFSDNPVWDTPLGKAVPGGRGSFSCVCCAGLIGEMLVVLFAGFPVFISSLVVTASVSCFLLSLLTEMTLNTQRWREALGWQ
jgi:hypothetical protein